MPFCSYARRWLVRSSVLVMVFGAAGAWAGPETTRVGETRIVYAPSGTVLRSEPSATGAPQGSLAKGTSVVVLEVQLPWAKVEGSPGPGKPAISGWIRAYQAIEPAKYVAPPPAVSARGGGAIDQRDTMAAGRQFDAKTEQGFRAKRGDLARGYALVDALEQDTARVDPGEAIEFAFDGAIGRDTNDFTLPGRVPAAPAPAPRAKPKLPDPLKEKAEDLLGGLLGGKRAGKAVAKGALEFGSSQVEARWEQLNTKYTPDNEYYLGRAVAANAFARYGVEPNQAIRRYVRRVGDAIVRASKRIPPNFGGYHFDVLATDEVNGISGPGGFVLVTRGAVMECQTEDELAGFLAHELAHVTRQHAEQVIRASKQQQSFSQGLLKGVAAATDLDDSRLGEALVSLFSNVIGEMARTSMEHAYGSNLEFDADLEGSYILNDVWYDWWALRNTLARLAQEGHAHGGATHASPQSRAAALDGRLAALGTFAPRDWVKPERKRRLDEAVGRAPTTPSPAAPAAPPAGSSPAWPLPR